jgi:hypothetical protein
VVEAQAVRMSRELGAELWLVSSCTGDNVLDFFFRLAAMNFDRSVLRELERDRTEIKIGYDLISNYIKKYNFDLKPFFCLFSAPTKPVKITAQSKMKRNPSSCKGQSKCV